jgi:hypothetical protein
MEPRSTWKNVVLGVAVIVGFLAIRHGMSYYRGTQSQLDEDIVHAHYQKQINALRGFDASTQCAALHRGYRGVDVVRSPEGEETFAMGEREACAAIRDSTLTLKALVKSLGVEPDMKFTIESIELSEDRRQATVKLRASMRLGDAFSSSSSGTEVLIRAKGHVFVLGSTTRTVIAGN